MCTEEGTFLISEYLSLIYGSLWHSLIILVWSCTPSPETGQCPEVCARDMKGLQPHDLLANLTRCRWILGLVSWLVGFKPVLPKRVRGSQGLCPSSSGCQRLCYLLVLGGRVWVFCCGMLPGPGGQALDALTESPGMKLHIPQLYVLLCFSCWPPCPYSVMFCCPQQFLMPQAYGAHNESSSGVHRVLQAVQLLITIYVHVLPFFILKLGGIKQ